MMAEWDCDFTYNGQDQLCGWPLASGPLNTDLRRRGVRMSFIPIPIFPPPSLIPILTLTVCHAKLLRCQGITGRYSQVAQVGDRCGTAAHRCTGSTPAMPHSWGGVTSGPVAGRGGKKQPLAR